MRVDLLAGTLDGPRPVLERRPTILVFDSGLGGLTVFAEIEALYPRARLVYAADDAAFPYGALTGDALVARVIHVMGRLVELHAPDLVVIACNTASTLVLPHLRARFALPFVGTVPAIKPSAMQSRTRLFSVLATPGTVARDYTRDLIGTYAADCEVTLVGSTRLAALAEAEMAGVPAPDEDILSEITPCFVRKGERATDVVALACTHYPLLLARLRDLAPWPVTWIDPAAAIARRVGELLSIIPRQEVPCPDHGTSRVPGRAPAERPFSVLAGVRPPLLPPGGSAVFTSGAGLTPRLRRALLQRGLHAVAVEPMPLAALT